MTRLIYSVIFGVSILTTILHCDLSSAKNYSKTASLSAWNDVVSNDPGVIANSQFAQEQINQQKGGKVYARVLKIHSAHNRSRFNRTETKLLLNVADTECKKNESLPHGNVNHCLLDKKAVSIILEIGLSSLIPYSWTIFHFRSSKNVNWEW